MGAFCLGVSSCNFYEFTCLLKAVFVPCLCLVGEYSLASDTGPDRVNKGGGSFTLPLKSLTIKVYYSIIAVWKFAVPPHLTNFFRAFGSTDVDRCSHRQSIKVVSCYVLHPSPSKLRKKNYIGGREKVSERKSMYSMRVWDHPVLWVSRWSRECWQPWRCMSLRD